MTEILRKNCARKLWLAPAGVAPTKRTGLALAANPEKSTLNFIILQLNKTNFWLERVNKL